ncbi:MAG: C4-dicarboxylate ABC transporter substrate-binding protein [Hyphomicrobiaceae bacterium]|nr:MAG: C4-dicarboxylate ABC transporter substrate-binding protein [Hyphomicrobiaceae bacterium]KAB2851816.1 MAG: C4-dicarboxylate ABC transporter substrate-binding protein [Hyphomicrobiaceae bacterium]
MRSKFGTVQLREVAYTLGPVVLLILAAFWAASQFITPAPPQKLVVAAATKGSPYYEAAQRYRGVLAANGVTLEVIETKGSLENLSLVTSATSNVSAAFLQGGLASSKEAPDLRSLGRLFYEPVWIFHQGAARIERLTDLAGKRVLIGPEGSGTAALALRLLAASGVTRETATLINMDLTRYVEALEQGAADAGILVLGPEARSVRRLLASPSVRLMNIAQADAYVQRFPFLTKIELKEGVVDFARNVPPANTVMLATTAALVVRQELHPALANLLTQAIISVHAQPMLNADGEAGILQRAGAFPLSDDQEFQLSPDAARVYKSGPPFLQRYMPFWMATLADRLLVLLLPAVGILLPALRFAPALYTWRVRRRIVYWYRELKRVEAGVGAQAAPTEIAAAMREVDRIEDAVNRLPVPLGFANQLYDLREHIDVVRRRLTAPRPAAA